MKKTDSYVSNSTFYFNCTSYIHACWKYPIIYIHVIFNMNVYAFQFFQTLMFWIHIPN